jgi:hypothetical protein
MVVGPLETLRMSADPAAQTLGTQLHMHLYSPHHHSRAFQKVIPIPHKHVRPRSVWFVRVALPKQVDGHAGGHGSRR